MGEVYDSSQFLGVFQKNNTYYLITGSFFGIEIHKRMGNTFEYHQNLGAPEGNKFYNSVKIFYQNNTPYFCFIGPADTDIFTWNEAEEKLSHIQNLHLTQFAFDFFIIEGTPWLALAYENDIQAFEWTGTQFTEKPIIRCPEANPKAIYVNNTIYLIAPIYEASTQIYKWKNNRFMPSTDFQVSSVNKTLATSFTYNDEQFFLFYTSKWSSETGETFEIDRWNGENMEQVYEGTTKSDYYNSFSVDTKQFIALNDNPKETSIESIYEWKDNKLELYQAIPDAYFMNYFPTYFTMDGKTYLLMTRPSSSTLYEWESNAQKDASLSDVICALTVLAGKECGFQPDDKIVDMKDVIQLLSEISR